MKAFHGDQKIKDNLILQLQKHYESDEIIKGVYWQHGKGCAVGCTIHSNAHKEYETQYGIPEALAYLEDTIFENLPDDLAKEWPLKFIKSINVGSDLSRIWPEFAIWLLSDEKYGVLQYAETEEQKSAIQKVIDLYSITDRSTSIEEWKTAARAAARAARAAEGAAEGAAWAAAWAAARAAAWAAEGAARAAAWAAEGAAEGAAWAAWAAAEGAAWAAEAAVKEKHFIAQSEKLLQLLQEAI
jgi:hypothetical protein